MTVLYVGFEVFVFSKLLINGRNDVQFNNKLNGFLRSKVSESNEEFWLYIQYTRATQTSCYSFISRQRLKEPDRLNLRKFVGFV